MEFYETGGVPDSLDGRFELVALHVFLVLHRLKRDRSDTQDLGQALFDALFLDMDQVLREMGAGDLGVGRRVKTMAKGFYGRISAYEEGLAASGDSLDQALRRNLYGTVDPAPGQVAAMADYARREAAGLAEQETADLLTGAVEFGAPPGEL